MRPFEAAETLSEIGYKPGWKLSWDFSWDSSAVNIRWHMTVPDAFNPEDVVEFKGATLTKVLDHVDEEGLVRDVYRLALQAETHEAREFFTYKGSRPFDPHRSVLNDGERYG